MSFCPPPPQAKMQVCSCTPPMSKEKKLEKKAQEMKKKNNQVPRLQKVQYNKKSCPQSHIYTSPVTKCWAHQCTNISGTSNLSVHIQGHPNSSTSYHSLMSSWSDNGQNEWETTLHNSRWKVLISLTQEHRTTHPATHRATSLQGEQEASAKH